jgi:hypothetical protein
MYWYHPANPKAALKALSGVYSGYLDVQGWIYTAPDEGSVVVPFDASGSGILGIGDTFDSINYSVASANFTIAAPYISAVGNVVTVSTPNPNKVSVKINVKTGVFSGTYFLPGTNGQPGQNRSFAGALLQAPSDENPGGVGFSIGTGVSDNVVLLPQDAVSQ